MYLGDVTTFGNGIGWDRNHPSTLPLPPLYPPKLSFSFKFSSSVPLRVATEPFQMCKVCLPLYWDAAVEAILVL